MNMKEFTLIGFCGLYCGACSQYLASQPDGRHILDKAISQGKNPEKFKCGGCRGAQVDLYPPCSQCKMRDCAKNKNLLHCGDCPEMPCYMLKEFQTDGRPHHLDILNNLGELKEYGCDKWLLNQEAKWKCACGSKYNWYETSCNNCGAAVNSYNKTR
jgi:hypothetical protein